MTTGHDQKPTVWVANLKKSLLGQIYQALNIGPCSSAQNVRLPRLLDS